MCISKQFLVYIDVMNLLKGMYFYTFIVIVTSINQRYNSCVFQRYQKKKCIFKIQISQCRLPGFYFLGEMIQIMSSVISFGCTCPYYVLRLIVVKYVCKRCGKLVLFFKAFISIVNTYIYECLNQNAFCGIHVRFGYSYTILLPSDFILCVLYRDLVHTEVW